METEITIDKKTGDILLNRDHPIMLKISKELSKDNQDFEKFFKDRPKSVLDGKEDRNTFCG